MDRERFLSEVAARLGRPRLREPPRREYGGEAPPGIALASAELTERFRYELTQVAGNVLVAHSAPQALSELAAQLRSCESVVSWARAELTRSCGLDLESVWRELGARCREPNAADFREALLHAEIGVTGVDYAIAETGTLALSAGVGRPRAVSLLPRLHIALVRERQILSRMSPSLEHYRRGMPSAIHYITGPSRTSDIENDLSIGVHGPARVLALIVPEEKP